MLNRFGQSIPPLLVSQQVSNLPRKKVALAVTTFFMGAAFLTLAAVWYFTKGQFAAMPLVFLSIYAFFFIATGISQLLVNTLIGKLVTSTTRGRLAAAGSIVGGLIAVLCAWFLLRNWLGAETGRFELVFSFTGVAFLIASCVSLTLIEERDTEKTKVQKSIPLLVATVKKVWSNTNERRLMIVASMFGMCIVLTPHYQTLARERLHVDFRSLIPWVIAQHIGASVITVPMGWLADRLGNRIVLQLLMFALSVTPILGLVLSWSGEFGRLSTLGIFISIPVVASSLIFGAMVDIVGFEIVFMLVLCFIVFGLITTFRLEEPRGKGS